MKNPTFRENNYKKNLRLMRWWLQDSIPLNSSLSLTLISNLKFSGQFKLYSEKLSPSVAGMYWREINQSLGVHGTALLEAHAGGSSFPPPSFCSKGSPRHFFNEAALSKP